MGYYFESLELYKYDLQPKGPLVLKIPITKTSHIDILKKGFGLGPTNAAGTKGYFKDMGWTFRTAPGP